MAQEEVTVAGQTANENLEGDQLRNLEIGQLRGREVQTERANVPYGTAGKPAIIPENTLWECNGGVDVDENTRVPCKFSCVKDINYSSFINTAELTILTWLCDHKLMDLECNRSGCDGSFD